MSYSSIACTVQPYRRDNSFTDWYTSIEYFFNINKIKDEDKMAYFIIHGGSNIFEELIMLYPAGNFEEIPFYDMIAKLENRLDKVEHDLGQRYKFNTRVQNPDETTEDFMLALKLQAEFCGFNNFKEVAILDRFIAGIKDTNLRQRLFSEEKLTLAKAKEIIAAYEVAKENTSGTEIRKNEGTDPIVAIPKGSKGQFGTAYEIVKHNLDLMRKFKQENFGKVAGSSKSPLRDSLEVKPTGFRYGKWRKGTKRPDYLQMEVHFCGIKGHSKCICNKIKSMQRWAVGLVDSHEEKLQIYGETKVLVKLNGNNESIRLRVLDGDRNFFCLLNRNWLNVFYPNWEQISADFLVFNNLRDESAEIGVVKLEKEYRLLNSLKYADCCFTFPLQREIPKENAPFLGFRCRDQPERVDRGVDKLFIVVFVKLQYSLFMDNGLSFNTYGYRSLFERRGNGQADRSFKEVLERFLMESDVAKLNVEDQISLLLVYLKNIYLTKGGQFPLKSLFSHKPKTALDLKDNKKPYNKIMYVLQPNDDNEVGHQSGKIQEQPVDLRVKLEPGDDTWCKKHNYNNHARWIKTTFIKKYSHNVLQICIGSVDAKAHRAHIRVCKKTISWQEPNVGITREEPYDTMNDDLMTSNDDSLNGVEEPEQTPKGGGKRRRRHLVGIQRESRMYKCPKKVNRSDGFITSEILTFRINCSQDQILISRFLLLIYCLINFNSEY